MFNTIRLKIKRLILMFAAQHFYCLYKDIAAEVLNE